MVFELSDQASQGFRNASSYDTHRPSYPPEIVDALLARLQVKGVPNARIVDLGAGTGKFTELLAVREEKYDVVAVEPHEEMRKALSAKNLSAVDVVQGCANDMPVKSQSADAVVAAQVGSSQYIIAVVLEVMVSGISLVNEGTSPLFASKSLDADGTRFATDDALEEIYRILAPGGSFGMIWNVEDYNAPASWEPTSKWEATMKEIMWSYDDQRPRFRHDLWRNVFDKQLSSTPFTIRAADPLFSLPLGTSSVRFMHWLHPDAIWQRFQSLSQISVLKGDELAGVEDKVFAAMSASSAEANEKGELPLHGHVVYTWTTAVPGAPVKEGG
ncbi:hypothetical protein XANCAGTX0491_000444 [Xanthoria calcicola]